MINVLANIGIVLGALTLEVIFLLLLETPTGKRISKKIKNKIRHFFWKYFDFKNDFVEK